MINHKLVQRCRMFCLSSLYLAPVNKIKLVFVLILSNFMFSFEDFFFSSVLGIKIEHTQYEI